MKAMNTRNRLIENSGELNGDGAEKIFEFLPAVGTAVFRLSNLQIKPISMVSMAFTILSHFNDTFPRYVR